MWLDIIVNSLLSLSELFAVFKEQALSDLCNPHVSWLTMAIVYGLYK